MSANKIPFLFLFPGKYPRQAPGATTWGVEDPPGTSELLLPGADWKALLLTFAPGASSSVLPLPGASEESGADWDVPGALSETLTLAELPST